MVAECVLKRIDDAAAVGRRTLSRAEWRQIRVTKNFSREQPHERA
jgi:hypothetical protein